MSEKLSNPIKGGRGGKREGAGRKKDVPNKRTAELQKAVEESGQTPLEYLLSVMRDVAEEPRTRLTAAQAAAPYVHAKLASIEVSGKGGGPVETVTRVELVGMSGNSTN